MRAIAPTLALVLGVQLPAAEAKAILVFTLTVREHGKQNAPESQGSVARQRN
jgi:hypothetical protein